MRPTGGWAETSYSLFASPGGICSGSVRVLRNLRERRPFSLHGYETRILAFMCVDGGLQCGERTGTTWPFDTPGPNRAAIA